MKLKQIVLASSLFFSCHLVAIGATYDMSSDQDLNPHDPFGQTSVPDKGFGNLMFESTAESRSKKEQLKQDYLEVIKLLKNNQLNTAENEIESLIKYHPNIAAFYNLEGLLRSAKKENKLAIQSFKKSVELAPKNMSSHLGLATLYLSTGELELAKQYANSALSIDDTSIHTYLLLAKIAYQEKKLHKVESILLAAQKKTRGDIQQEIVVAGNIAKLYLTQKKPKKALAAAQDIIKRYPDNSSALALLANTQIYSDHKTQAIFTLDKLIKQEKQDVQHRLLLAKLLIKHAQHKQQVVRLLGEIDAIAPDNTQVQVQRTILLTQLGQFQKALQVTKKIKQLAPDAGLAEALEGEVYLAEKKQDLALPAFQKSYALKPNNKLLSMISNLMIVQGKQQDAINFLNQALKETPENLAIHFNLGNIYQQQNDTNKAKDHYQTVLAKQPDNVVILNNLAWIYHLENDPKALILAKKAYQKAPDSAAVADTYASILVKEGDLVLGLKIFQHAGKLAPANYDIQYHLANAYAANKQNKQAINILQKIPLSEQSFSEQDAAVQLLNKLQ